MDEIQTIAFREYVRGPNGYENTTFLPAPPDLAARAHALSALGYEFEAETFGENVSLSVYGPDIAGEIDGGWSEVCGCLTGHNTALDEAVHDLVTEAYRLVRDLRAGTDLV